jgi:Asp-tRNA(Asn)/Glu-tRNA(Gln) amidotransferase A subunit family amidase
MDTPIRARDIRSAIARREISATEVSRAALDRIAQRNPPLNAFRAIASERALARAA